VTGETFGDLTEAMREAVTMVRRLDAAVHDATIGWEDDKKDLSSQYKVDVGVAVDLLRQASLDGPAQDKLEVLDIGTNTLFRAAADLAQGVKFYHELRTGDDAIM
jgi:AICAR transformylase/IMP cyclohydrolase PurH